VSQPFRRIGKHTGSSPVPVAIAARCCEQKTNFMEHYNFFLFSQLWLEVNGGSEEPYDELFATILRDFHEFSDSDYNDEDEPLYECILEYLNQPVESGRYIVRLTTSGSGLKSCTSALSLNGIFTIFSGFAIISGLFRQPSTGKASGGFDSRSGGHEPARCWSVEKPIIP